MPWTGPEFANRHNHKLSGGNAKKAARQANAILKKTGDEGLAIAVANKNAGRSRKKSVRGRDVFETALED